MKNAALRSCSMALGLALFGSISTRVEAVDAYTDPVGYYTLTIQGGSDNVMSLPMVRDAVFSGTVSGGITATGFTALAGQVSPGWTASQFQYRDATNPQPQGQTYYVEFTSGQLKGLFYKISNNGTDTVSLDTEGDSLLDHDFGNLPDQKVVVGDSFKIRPYWRIKDVFEVNGTPIIESRPFAGSLKDDILIPNYTVIDQNKAPDTIIYHVAGQGWRAQGFLSQDFSEYVLRPNEALIVRRRNAAPVSLTNLGGVLMNRSISFVPGGDATTGNDTYISISRPAAVSLDQSGLRIADQTKSLVKDSPASFNRQDEVLMFEPGTGFNKAASRIYFYLAGQGWRQVGNLGDTTVGQTVMVEPGQALIVRKKAGNAGADLVNDPNY